MEKIGHLTLQDTLFSQTIELTFEKEKTEASYKNTYLSNFTLVRGQSFRIFMKHKIHRYNVHQDDKYISFYLTHCYVRYTKPMDFMQEEILCMKIRPIQDLSHWLQQKMCMLRFFELFLHNSNIIPIWIIVNRKDSWNPSFSMQWPYFEWEKVD